MLFFDTLMAFALSPLDAPLTVQKPKRRSDQDSVSRLQGSLRRRDIRSLSSVGLLSVCKGWQQRWVFPSCIVALTSFIARVARSSAHLDLLYPHAARHPSPLRPRRRSRRCQLGLELNLRTGNASRPRLCSRRPLLTLDLLRIGRGPTRMAGQVHRHGGVQCVG